MTILPASADPAYAVRPASPAAQPVAEQSVRPAGGPPLTPELRAQLTADVPQTPVPPKFRGGPKDGELARKAAVDGDAEVLVEVLYEGHDERPAVAAIEAAGGTVTGHVPGALVEARVRAKTIRQIELAHGVVHVRHPELLEGAPVGDSTAPPPPAAAETAFAAPSVTGEHVAKMNVLAWQNAGYKGQGVKVGIIDSFDSAAWTAAQSAGEVPAPSATFCRFGGSSCNIWSGGTVHGVAVAEVIHDQAPMAQLYLASVGTASDLQAALDWFVANGVKIVSRSQAVPYDGPGDGTGAVATAVNNGIANGLTIFKSAGNTAGGSGNPGSYWRGSWYDPDGDGWLNFSGSDETLGMVCGYQFGFRWSDWGVGSPSDYDIFWYDSSGILLGSSTAVQDDATDLPLERIPEDDCPGGVVYLKVHLWDAGSGTAGDVLEYMVNASAFEYWQSPYSAASPMGDSSNPGLMSVGAIDPALGTTIAYYSSQGPTNDGRIKPDVSAPSCLQSYSYPSPDCFNGTSAAAPAAAGAAAVVLGSGVVGNVPLHITTFLRSSVIDRGAPGPDNVYGRGEIRLPDPPPPSTGRYTPVTPARIVDSRDNTGGFAGTPWGPGQIRQVQVGGQGGVPSDATAVVANVTAVSPSAPSHLSLYPTGSPTPWVSNLNFVAGQTVPNLVVVKLGTAGRIDVRNNTGSVHVVIDVVGYFKASTGSRFNPLTPMRILDSRDGTGGISGRWAPGQTRDLTVTTGSVPSAATAVVLNVTVTGPTAPSHLTVWPAGVGMPLASNLNFVAGQTVPNLVIVGVGTGGKVSIYNNSGSVHVIADVVGYFEAGAGSYYTGITPARILDSRDGTGSAPLPWLNGETRSVKVAGMAGIPTDATAVVLNVTVTGPTAPSHLTVWPAGVGMPLASNLNFVTGQTVPNLVVVKLGASGNINIFNNAGWVHVIGDVVGYFQ
ncbi:MAG: S8 family serine peptidase [Acidimicrobiales bacterium]|nr:S8 family serine peptidase [Acidimicrobiales bacterium]